MGPGSLLPANHYALVNKGVLGHRLPHDVGRLALRVNGKQLDQALPHKLSKMVVEDIDILGARAHLG